VDFDDTDKLLITSVNFDETDGIFGIRQILEKKWEYSETVHQPSINIKKAYNSVTRKEFCNILIGVDTPTELWNSYLGQLKCLSMKPISNFIRANICLFSIRSVH
jgi:hypothetical protein